MPWQKLSRQQFHQPAPGSARPFTTERALYDFITHFCKHSHRATAEALLNTVQIRARRVLRGGPGGEIPRHVAPEQRLRGAFLAHVIPPEALLRGYTRGKNRPGSSPPWLISIPPSWLLLLSTVLRHCSAVAGAAALSARFCHSPVIYHKEYRYGSTFNTCWAGWLGTELVP